MPEATEQTALPDSTSGHMAGPGSILRNRNFILLWCAYTVSALGDHLSEMALLDIQNAIHRDDSTRIMAIITFSFFVPYFLFGPVMGWLADRCSRRRIMIFADMMRAMLMASLVVGFPWLFRVLADSHFELQQASNGGVALFSPWVYASPLFVVGLFAAMFSPSRAAMLPTIVRTDQIIRANGLMNAMGPIAAICSYLLGAHLVEKYNPDVCFMADAGTFLLSATFILFIIPPRPRARSTITQKAKRRFRDGLKYCQTHRRVIELLLFTVLFWTAATAIRCTVPALVKSVFSGSLLDVASYNAAIGIGLLVGAFLIGGLGETLKSQIVISWSFVGAGLSTLCLAAVVLMKTGFWTGAAFLFLACLFGSAVLVSANALLQKTVPDFVRGRVFGVKDVVTIGGILLATGGLGIPHWPNIDRFVPAILVAVGLMLLVAGVWITCVRLRRGKFGAALEFWRNVAAFHNKLIARVRRDGICTVPTTGPVILAANHHCSLDPFLLVSTSPNRYPSFMIAQEFARIPFFARIVNLIDCIPVNRTGVDTASVRAALRHLQSGRMLGIFPQGGIQDPSEPLRVRQGVGMLALASGATVIPAFISGTHHSDSVVTPFLRRQRAVVRYGKPVDLSRWAGREHDRTAHREVAEHIMAQINALAPSL